jgi:hypothetical protein
LSTAWLMSVPAAASRQAALGLLWLYRYGISGLKPPCCRFHPTCSAYAYDAVARFGLLRGGWLALCRLCRCHPFYRGPLVDPVPDLPADGDRPDSQARTASAPDTRREDSRPRALGQPWLAAAHRTSCAMSPGARIDPSGAPAASRQCAAVLESYRLNAECSTCRRGSASGSVARGP